MEHIAVRACENVILLVGSRASMYSCAHGCQYRDQALGPDRLYRSIEIKTIFIAKHPRQQIRAGHIDTAIWFMKHGACRRRPVGQLIDDWFWRYDEVNMRNSTRFTLEYP